MTDAPHPLMARIDNWTAQKLDGYCAEIWYTEASAGPPWHITLQLTGPAIDQIDRQTALFLQIMAAGKQAFIRVMPPNARMNRDFETDTVIACGQVRFTLFDVPGSWEISSHGEFEMKVPIFEALK